MNKVSYSEGLELIMKRMFEDYVSWSEIVASKNDWESDIDMKYYIEPGRNYDKIVKVSHGSSSVAGFVVKKATKKFPVGAILKAASWKAPATNFSRGSIFDPESYKYVRWTGVS